MPSSQVGAIPATVSLTPSTTIGRPLDSGGALKPMRHMRSLTMTPRVRSSPNSDASSGVTSAIDATIDCASKVIRAWNSRAAPMDSMDGLLPAIAE
jgi:hypothetical protein